MFLNVDLMGKQDFMKMSLCDGIPWAKHINQSLSILKRIAKTAVWVAVDFSKRKQPLLISIHPIHLS